MPVYKPIKPSLPKDEFRAYNKRKIIFVSISIILTIGSIIILYLAFRPNKSDVVQTQSNQETVANETTNQNQNQTIGEKKETTNNTKGETYKVQSGDTLFTIGEKFNIDWHEISKANNLTEPYSLTVGQELTIPASSGSSTSNTSQ